jgi:hypothetical protein
MQFRIIQIEENAQSPASAEPAFRTRILPVSNFGR